MDIWLIISILFMHFILDFVCQTDEMALNKSTKFGALLFHCIVYSFFFIIFGFMVFIITFIQHIVIDFITSKINALLWEKNERHWFFVCIGFDQFLHISILLLTIYINTKGF